MARGRRIRLRGLNRRKISVDTLNILFLEEHELDGTLCTNVHFGNGKWVTSALSLDEVEALLDSDDDKASKEQVDMWKKRARERVEMDTEIEEIKRQIGEEFTNMKNKSFHRQKYPDGSYEFKIILEPASAVDEAGS